MIIKRLPSWRSLKIGDSPKELTLALVCKNSYQLVTDSVLHPLFIEQYERERSRRKKKEGKEEEIPKAHYAGGNDDKWRGCASGMVVDM